MKILRLLLLFIPITSGAFEVIEYWNQSFAREIKLICPEKESDYCNYLCQNNNQCVFTENFCRNCAGTDLYLQSLFLEMGKRYRNSGITADPFLFFDFLKKNQFISLNAKSVYNFVDHYNSPSLRFRFQILCNFAVEYPLVFIEAEGHSRLPGKVRYLVCGNEIFEMEDMTDTIVIP